MDSIKKWKELLLNEKNNNSMISQLGKTNQLAVDSKDPLLSVSKREQFLEEYNYCSFCGSEYLFTHVTDFIEGQVKEEAYCMTCQIRTKQNDHKLQ